MKKVAPVLMYLILATIVCSGCAPKSAPVSGKVTYKGKPLASYVVLFEPSGVKDPLRASSFGTTDQEGKYKLESVKGKQPLCPVGKCIVRISWKDPNPPDVSKNPDGPTSHMPPIMLPPSATDGTMTFDVPPDGTENANFDL